MGCTLYSTVQYTFYLVHGHNMKYIIYHNIQYTFIVSYIICHSIQYMVINIHISPNSPSRAPTRCNVTSTNWGQHRSPTMTFQMNLSFVKHKISSTVLSAMSIKREPSGKRVPPWVSAKRVCLTSRSGSIRRT